MVIWQAPHYTNHTLLPSAQVPFMSCCRFIGLLSVALLSALSPANRAAANDGEPVAVQVWPGGVVSVQTQWGLQLAINAFEAELPESLDSFEVVSASQTGQRVLDRVYNTPEPTWTETDWTSGDGLEPNQLGVQILADHFARVQVDGVNVVIAGPQIEASDYASLGTIDVLLGTGLSVSNSDLLNQVRALVPLMEEPAKEAEMESNGDPKFEFRRQSHNALAVASNQQDASTSTRVVFLSDQPWQMPAELDELFEAMEQSCSHSQDIFAKMSIEQLNFKPANGTHTPRWNVEHMMGRQLQFFSQIYHAIDPTIPVMNLNPKQMPPDYEFAHPKWNGEEEARQMQRVSDFCRRYAYLLDGLNVDEKAPGSRWPSLKALLKKMAQHYGEHTGNTVKKFDLPGYPG